MKFNILVLALFGNTDAESLELLMSEDPAVNATDAANTTNASLATNATNAANATNATNATLAQSNSSANASAKANDTQWTTTTTSSSSSWSTSSSSSSSSSSSWSSSSSSDMDSWNSTAWGSMAPPVIETETVTETESASLGIEFGQIKLIGNNDGRTAFIPTTDEPYIKASISTHRDLNNHNAQKRPNGNKRFNKQKFAFIQDNDWIGYEQKWKMERHKTQANNIWRLVDTTGHCLTANAPQDFKRNKISSYVTAVYGDKGSCSFWRKVPNGDGWNLVLARPGLKGSQKKFAFQKGWGLSILNNKKTDQELGKTTAYLVLHKNPKKFSQWSSKILGAPPHVVQNVTQYIVMKQVVEVEHPPANDTNSTNATVPVAPAAAPQPVASAPPANATNKTNATNKSNKTRPTMKRRLPTPFKGTESDDEDDHPENQDNTIDSEDDDDCDDDETSLREKIMKSLRIFQTNSGYLDIRWFRCLKFHDDQDDEDFDKDSK